MAELKHAEGGIVDRSLGAACSENLVTAYTYTSYSTRKTGKCLLEGGLYESTLVKSLNTYTRKLVYFCIATYMYMHTYVRMYNYAKSCMYIHTYHMLF